ncbi:MAG: PspC domain-containing protein [Muribaculaceae bacterium]
MKKTLPVNISGKVYYIDEDAYDLLKNYLFQLRNAFPGDEGAEIVSDIESRISELFEARINEGANVITYADVNKVIETMGRPSDLSDASDYDGAAAQPGGNTAGNAAGSGAGVFQNGGNDPDYMTIKVKKHLYRNVNNKVFGGVMGGLATYLGWDATIMRIFYVVLMLFTYFWPLLLIYMMLWMVIPPANTPLRVLNMQGAPVTVDNIGQSVLSSTPPPYQGVPAQQSGSSNFFATVVSVAAKCIMALIGMFSSMAALALFVAFMAVLTGMIAYVATGSEVILQNLNFQMYDSVVLGCSTVLCALMMIMIPCIALTWLACCVLFKAPSASKTVVITGIVLEVIFIAATVVLGTIVGASLSLIL